MKINHAKLLSTVIAAVFYLIAGMVLIVGYDKLRKMSELYRDLHTNVQPALLAIGIGFIVLALSLWLSAYMTFILVNSTQSSPLDKEHNDLLGIEAAKAKEPLQEKQEALIEFSEKESNEVASSNEGKANLAKKQASENVVEKEVILTAIPDEALAKILDILNVSRTGQFQFPEKPSKKNVDGCEKVHYSETFMVPLAKNCIDLNSKDLAHFVDKLNIDALGGFTF